MAGPVNQFSGVNNIGLPFVYSFLSLRGQPDAVKQRLEILVRNGVAGVGLFQTGVRGAPFSLVSAVDAASFAVARALYSSYRTLIGANPIEITWSDLDIDSIDAVEFAVLNVTPLVIQRIGNSSGGLNSPSNGWIEARWDLIPIAT